MAPAGGYQLQELLMQVVLYSQIAQQPLEKQLNNVKFGVTHAFQMEFHVYQNPNAHLIKHN